MDEAMEIGQTEMDAVFAQLSDSFKKESDQLTDADYDAHVIVYYIVNQDSTLSLH